MFLGNIGSKFDSGCNCEDLAPRQIGKVTISARQTIYLFLGHPIISYSEKPCWAIFAVQTSIDRLVEIYCNAIRELKQKYSKRPTIRFILQNRLQI